MLISTTIAPFVFQLGDTRLNRRAVAIVNRFLHSNLQLGFPGIFTEERELKAFYRFINNGRLHSSDMVRSNLHSISNYFENLEKPSSCEDESVTDVYCIQDTSFIDYTDRFHVQLGYTQNKSSRENSALLHSMIACNDAGHPIGLLHQDFFVRSSTGEELHYSQREFEQRESYKWVKGLSEVKLLKQTISSAIRPIVIGDRESDSVDIMCAHFDQGIDFIIRSKSNRNILRSTFGQSENDISTTKLHDWIRRGEGVSKTRQLRQLHSRHCSKYYKVECDIHYGQAKVANLKQPIGIIHLREDISTRTEACPGTDAAEWFLLTSLSLDTPEEAIKWLDAYVQRWPVTEDFHKVLKTGAKIERRQLQSKEALEKATTLISLASVRILSMRYLAEDDPDLPLEESPWGTNEQLMKILSQLDQEVLSNRDRDFSKPATIKRLVQIIARMGGHQGYARKGRPGWHVLWIGNQKLDAILRTLDKYG